MKYINAEQAFEDLYISINDNGYKVGNTKVFYNKGFYILNPLDNNINTKFRKWNLKYAKREWDWYLSKNPSAKEISKFAPIWKKHMDQKGNVRSNYGWQWNRNKMLHKVINKLKNDNFTRQAVLSIYDGKEIDTYNFDTPCTNSIHFQIIDKKVCMTVNMRSNDLWYGFCNDQYCFSELLRYVSNELSLESGWYYHFASNLHLYEPNFKIQ